MVQSGRRLFIARQRVLLTSFALRMAFADRFDFTGAPAFAELLGPARLAPAFVRFLWDLER
jgi:hypothetical protein